MRAAAGTSEATWAPPLPGSRWLRTWRLGEWLAEPLSPLFETLLLPVLAAGRESAGSGRLGFRLPAAWHMRRPSYMVLHGYFFARADPFAPSVWLLPLRYLWSELSGGWLTRWEQQARPEYRRRLAALQARLDAGASAAAILDGVDALALDVAEMWYAVSLGAGGASPLQQFIRGLCRREIDEALGGDALLLYRGFHTAAVEAQESLYRLAQLARTDAVVRALETRQLGELLAAAPSEPALQPFAAQVARHLGEHGYETHTLDFVAPTLAEEPARLGVALSCYLTATASSPARAVAQLAEERQQAEAAVRARLRGPRRALFDRLLARAQHYCRVREEAVCELQRAWPLLRRALLDVGARLAGGGVVGAAADVFFLTRAELVAAAQGYGDARLRAHVVERRALHAERRALTPPTRIPDDDAAWVRAMRWPVSLRALGRAGGTPAMLVGTAASSGRVRARARLLAFPSEHPRLGSGEVLVVAATTPSWTPLFARAGAVVTDVGAVSSHSSIVAREYGIPAVVGTQEATRVIHDGQMVTVDGSAGRVYLE